MHALRDRVLLTVAVVGFTAVQAFKSSFDELLDEEAVRSHSAQPPAESHPAALGLSVDGRGRFVHQRREAHSSDGGPRTAAAAEAEAPPEAAWSDSQRPADGEGTALATIDSKSRRHSENHTDSHWHKNAITWYCHGYCVDCDSGVSWRVKRSQPTSRKIAKAFAFGILAAVATMAGPYAGFAGGLYLGAFSMFGLGTGAVVGGGFIGMGYLMTSIHDRACPIVAFEEKLPRNKGILHGIFANVKNAAKSLFSMRPEELKFTLNDLNFQELVLRLQQPNGTAIVMGDRQGIDKNKRIKMALACNILTFNKKTWIAEKAKQGAVSQDVEAEIEKHILEECGQWLCAKSKVKDTKRLGFYSSCGGFGRWSIGNVFR
mmetsp:Transcript_27931/g.86989  ORF Transcript_27931/g.86989 Transcript_27931/m.86989 type:complete len:374 (+) Transcript_27931:65-1186(+)